MFRLNVVVFANLKFSRRLIVDFIPSAMDFIQRYAFALSAKGYEAEGLTLDLLTVELSRAEKFLLPTGADLGIKLC